MAEQIPLTLQDAPALIEGVFPAQKVSFEAQKERKANLGQTLTGLGSYWKGRKPLILVRSIVLGSLLPQTDDNEKDLEIFEALMGFDDEGLARRALIQNVIKPKDFASFITLGNPWDFFSFSIKIPDLTPEEVETWEFPFDADAKNITLRWRRDIDDENKLVLYRKALATFGSYEEKASLCKRPEELDQEWLYAPVWAKINRHYAHLNINAHSHQELIEQLGILRYGHRPRVGDTFSGGGSIPFEAARLGCDVYASDLNPIACMLTWGALNIIGASPDRRAEIEQAQIDVANAVDEEITKLGIEHDERGNRAKAYLYCLEARCPETGWMVPISPSWVISQDRKVIAKLIPDHQNRRFDIEVVTGVSKDAMKVAAKGTVQEGSLVYELGNKIHRTPIKTLRGDYRDAEGNTGNRLRRWNKQDFKPHFEDILQERLYAIQWIKADTLDSSRPETFFASITEADRERERKVERIVAENLSRWQEEGLVPDMEIEPGDKTDEPIRTRGWTYWHHLFSPRQLLSLACLHKAVLQSPCKTELMIAFAKTLDRTAKLCQWSSTHAQDIPLRVFVNQALNTLSNWGVRASSSFIGAYLFREFRDIGSPSLIGRSVIETLSAALNVNQPVAFS